MIRSFFVLLFYCILIESKHFNGGIINWAPVNPSSNSSTVSITITQSYFWTANVTLCSNIVPITPGEQFDNNTLKCAANCSAIDGYTPIDIITDCKRVSTVVNTMASQRSHIVDLNADAFFSITYRDNYWLDLNHPLVSKPPWAMVASIDVRRRSDGFINTPPIASVVSPRYAIVNQTTKITIPIFDVNGDVYKCRWAKNDIIDECDGICYPSSVPTGTYLEGCTVSFIGYVVGTWYGIAIQVEDFIDNITNTSMSSIPVQFLVYIISPPTCGLTPVILSLNVSSNVQVGVPVHFNISAATLCNPNISNIDSIMIAYGVDGMQVSNASDYPTNASVSYATFIWTPTTNQIGLQELCVVAFSDEQLQSDQYCIIFNVTDTSPSVTVTTTTTSTSVDTTTSTKGTTEGSPWSVFLIAIVATLGALLLLSALCFLCWLCCHNSCCQHNQQTQDMEQNFDQASAMSNNTGETIGTQHSWIPIVSVPIFRPNVIALNVVRPLRLGRTAPTANRRQTITVFRHI